MLKYISAVIVAGLTAACNPYPSDCVEPGSSGIHVDAGFLGNSLVSQMKYDTIDLLECGGHTVDISYMTISAASLQTVLESPGATTEIEKGHEVVFVMDSPAIDDYATVQQAKDLIEAAGSEMVLYQTWGREEDTPESVIESYTDAALYFDVDQLPAGEAWFTSETDNPWIDLFSDSMHGNANGIVLVSSLFYAYLTGESPVGLWQNKVPPDIAVILQQTAWDTYLEK